MKKKNVLLSISMLSSGLKPYLEECLKGIAALRGTITMELIIVDTSEDKSGPTRELIESYADEVVDFDWCDDFSAARNAGVRRCRGKWFMFVDDDEVLEDPAPIVNFFRTRQHNKYNTASVIIRNYYDTECKESSDTWVPRLYRMYPDAGFEGRVHENFQPAIYPLKGVDAVFKHYGYIFNTAEEFEAHYQRNMTLLEKEIEAHPDDVNMQMQLLQEYVRKYDFVKQREVAEYCLTQMEGTEERQQKVFRGVCTALLLRADRIEGRYTEGVKRILALKSDTSYDEVPVAKAFFALEGARIFDLIEDFDFAKKEAEEYYRIYNSLKDDMSVCADQLVFYLANTFEPENLGDMQDVLDGKRATKRLHIRLIKSAENKYTDEYYKEMFAPDHNPFAHDVEAWEYATVATVDVEAMIQAMDLHGWMRQVDDFMDIASTKVISRIRSCINTIKKSEDVRYDYYFSRTDEKMLCAFAREHDGYLPEDEEDIVKVYDLFIERLKGLGKEEPEFYEKYADLLTDEEDKDWNARVQLARKVSELMSLDFDDPKQILGATKEMMHMYPPFDLALTYFAHLYGAYVKQGGNQKVIMDQNVAEMRQIISVLEKKVEELIAGGMIDEARMVMEEIKKYT